MKIKLTDMIAFESDRKKKQMDIRKFEKSIDFISFSKEEQQSIDVKETVYFLQVPKGASSKQIDLYKFLYGKLDYRFKRGKKAEDFSRDTFVMIGYSEHKHWTPFYRTSLSQKGGKPEKVFSQLDEYQTDPHIHITAVGKKAYQTCIWLHKALSKKIKMKPTKDTIRSRHCVNREYIRAQSTLYGEFGMNVNSYFSKYQNDNKEG